MIKRSRNVAKPVRIEADGLTEGRQKQADGHERERQARGERRRAVPMARRRGAEHDRQDRQHAGERIERTPASSARTGLPMVISEVRPCRWIDFSASA